MPSRSDADGDVGQLVALSAELARVVDDVADRVVALMGFAADLSAATGSGFVIDANGHVVTNQHVVSDLLGAVRVSIPGEAEVTAQVVGSDPLTDIAVVRLDPAPPTFLELRDEPARLGELCIAVGSPLGMYAQSVSLGVVSGVARSIPVDTGPGARSRTIEHAIQTDAAINPGNSGGPLLDVRGRVIGVNHGSDTRATNISLAIPAETVAYVTRELIEHGEVQRASLGVAVVVRQVLVDQRRQSRVVVARITREQEDGLEAGDVMLRLDGNEVTDRGDLYRLLSRERIGVPVLLDVLRGDRGLTVSIRPQRLA